MRMLLIEDNVQLRASLSRGLRESQISVEAVGTGSEALQHLRKRASDVVVLDLGLPDIDGLELLNGARDMGVLAPVLVLSARDAVGERVRALNAGADDYVVKPFDLAELVARLHALLRRASAPRWAPLYFGNLRVQAERPEAHVGERSITLSPREHALLQHLVRHGGQVASRSEIMFHVFRQNFDPGTNVIDVHIAHLRRKLEGTDVHVETVRGHGYRLRVSSAADPIATDD
jgi:DNA-binding response OmpR family regulator